MTGSKQFLSAFVLGGMMAASTLRAQQGSTSYQRLAAAFAMESAGNPRGAMQAAQSLIDNHALTPLNHASALDLVGICYGDLDQPEKEVRVLEEAEELLGAQDGKVATSVLDNMARAYSAEGQSAIAQHLYERAFRLAETMGDHGDMARIASNQAGEVLRTRKYKQAQKYLERAELEAKLAMDGNKAELDKDDLALTASMRGWLALDKGDARSALEWYLQALELWKEEHGERHPSTAWGMLLVGQAQAKAGDPEAGARRMREGLTLLAATRGETSQSYAAGEMVYARLLNKSGNTTEAAVLLQDAQTKVMAFTSQNCRGCTVSVMALH